MHPRLLQLITVALVLAGSCGPACVRAAVDGGSVPLGGLASLDAVAMPGPGKVLPGPLADNVPRVLAQARQLQVLDALRRHREVLDVDAQGALVLRREVVAIDPTRQALDRARDAGFEIIDESVLAELGLRVVRLRAPSGMGTRSALRRLRRLDPGGSYDFNHVYVGTGTDVDIGAAASARVAAPAVPTTFKATGLRVGLIDSGVAVANPAFAHATIKTWGCEGRSRPDAHGTAVASLLLGAGEGARGDTLHAADIYCGRADGGATTRLVQALAWMARERVTVINLSLVGPPNTLLERAIRAMSDQGHVLVAAVGNDGPAAPPLFPAAYPQVIAVTAVDARHRALPEAGRGPHVDFAAAGSALRVATPDGGWTNVRGTSFAAPAIVRAAARFAGPPGVGVAERVEMRLARSSLDLGRPGRDEVYGQGLVQAETRIGSVE